MNKNQTETVFVDESLKVEKMEKPTENKVENSKKTAKNNKKSIKMSKNDVISLLQGYIHPNYSFIVANEGSGTCLICDKITNMSERKLCPDCFKLKREEIYIKTLNSDGEIEIEV